MEHTASADPRCRTNCAPESHDHTRAPHRRRRPGAPRFPGLPPDARPARRPLQGPLRRGRHDLRDVGFPVPVLPRLRPGHHACARAGVHQHRQGPPRLHQPATHQRPPQRPGRRSGRHVRGPAGPLLGHARSAVPTPGRMGQTHHARGRSARPGRLGAPRSHRARALRGRQRDGLRGRRRRRAGTPCRSREHPHLLHRGRPARGCRAGDGVPRGAGLDLPGQDRALMARPSFMYRLGLALAHRALPFAARFDKKLARGLDARRGGTERLTAWGRSERDAGRPLVWVHAPSVGEGLQAKPVLEALRAEAPSWQLAYTFFSPSAERLARTLPADVADYLPLDRPVDVAAVLDALKPTALVFSKLDVWPELTLAAARRGVKLGLISATVAPTSSRLRWPTRGWAEPAYRALDRIGTISEADGRRLEQLGARRSALQVTGDTLYDCEAEQSERIDRTRDPFARLAIAPAGTFTIVAGSTWPADEAVVLPAFVDLLAQVPSARLVLAPHEPNPDHLAGIAQAAKRVGLPRPVRLSQVEHTSSAPVIVVDRGGILADLYALADVAVVGGGYHRAGLHSALDPAVFGVPVAVGPHWQMSRDATLLIERGGAVALSADGRHQLHSQWLVWHHDPGARAKAGAAGKRLVREGRGAAERTTALVKKLVAR